MTPNYIHFIFCYNAILGENLTNYINHRFQPLGIKWGTTILNDTEKEIYIEKIAYDKADIIAVYGGDGTVVKVAKALIGSHIPLAILPAGTANVLAKGLGIPSDLYQAIDLIVGPNNKTIHIDTGLVNGLPFVIRVNFGIMSNMVRMANRELKDSFGQFAYGISAIEALSTTDSETYRLCIDGKETIEEGVSLTVTNDGNIGIMGFDLLPGISMEDGLLDVVLLKDSNLFSLANIAGSILFHNESEMLMHKKAKEITISMSEPVCFICDDEEMTAQEVHIQVMPKSLCLLVPS